MKKTCLLLALATMLAATSGCMRGGLLGKHFRRTAATPVHAGYAPCCPTDCVQQCDPCCSAPCCSDGMSYGFQGMPSGAMMVDPGMLPGPVVSE